MPPILDGDMLVQFLELTGEQQQAILTHALPGKGQHRPLSVFQVLQTLERVHYALNWGFLQSQLLQGLDIRAGWPSLFEIPSELRFEWPSQSRRPIPSLPWYLSERLIDDATGAWYWKISWWRVSRGGTRFVEPPVYIQSAAFGRLLYGAFCIETNILSVCFNR